MHLAPSEKNASCPECLEIARELREAHNQAHEQNHAAWDALKALIGGSEQDAERADELLAPYRFQQVPALPPVSAALEMAMRKSQAHLMRTGHWAWFAYGRR